MEEKHDTRSTVKRDAFASIAFWQFLVFFFLLACVWASEFFDLPNLVFGAPRSEFSLYRAFILSAAVITAAIVTVGHTYEKQRTIVKKLLMTCLYCHRVKTDEGSWMHVEEYFTNNYPVAIDRDACPDCQAMLQSVDSKAKSANAKPKT